MQTLLFISHANPEDNDFTLRLGLQLAREGYQTWSDITKLIGGESSWGDIEEAIRNYTIKFLYVLSRVSNTKQGALDELYLAKTVAKTDKLRDFIIPLRVDDLPHSDINVALHRINTIDFSNGWANGLGQLLEKLNLDTVPKNPDKCNPSVVSLWWRSHKEGAGTIKNAPERCLSNWFPVLDTPEAVFIHSPRPGSPPFSQAATLPYPSYSVRQNVISFAQAEELNLNNSESISISFEEFINPKKSSLSLDAKQRRNAIIYLFRVAWISFIKSKLPIYEMANEKYCAFFTKDKFNSKFQVFDIPEWISGRRTLTGLVLGKTWHFGISADIQLEPFLTYIIFPHVLFSDDGQNIWDSASRLHKARRSVCKNWWNDHWRDRIMASMYWLTKQQDSEDILIPVSSITNIRVSIKCIAFESPVSYDDLLVTQVPFESGEYSDDDSGLGEEIVEEIK
jgi:hypothetical protein